MIQKVKTVFPVTLAEARRQLRLDDDFIRDDAEILDIIRASIEIAESEIQKDIAKTTNVLTWIDFSGSVIRVNEGNLISITSVEVEENPTPLSNYNVYILRDRFSIDLDNDISTELLTVTFETGFEANKCPYQIKRAILLKVADLYDVYRSSSVTNNTKDSGAFETLLAPFKSAQVNTEPEN